MPQSCWVLVWPQSVLAWPRLAWAMCSARSSRARFATRPPPKASRGRLFIGFAAAELLGLLAFVVAMILLFVA
jgi:F0F1-type ATP synthase membrane subunit c/vacuolar-type H+-ATPase subunit K